MIKITYWKNKPVDKTGLEVKNSIEKIVKSIGGVLDKDETEDASTSRIDTLIYTLDSSMLEKAQSKIKDKHPNISADVEVTHADDDNPSVYTGVDSGAALYVTVNSKKVKAEKNGDNE